jgi:SAM-dependent methyltransferase
VAGDAGHRPGRAVGPPLSANRWLSSRSDGGDDYDRRLAERPTTGPGVHGEADLVAALAPATVLDAGCGTGRVAIELARRGVEAVGVDIDPEMLGTARRKAPGLTWIEADLATVTVAGERGGLRSFEVVVLAGNVMIFLTPGTEGAVIANLARHLAPGGALVAGFQLQPGRLDLAAHDRHCAAAGLRLEGRWATWERDPWQPGGDYAVSLHRLSWPRLGGGHPAQL